MPYVYDATERTEELASTMVAIMGDEGVRGLSLRAVSRRSGVTTSSALNHYGSWARLRTLGAALTASRRQDQVGGRHVRDLLAYVPSTATELRDARAWLGWEELGRADESIAAVVAVTRDNERHDWRD